MDSERSNDDWQSYLQLSLQNTLSNRATKSLSGLKVIETIPDMSIPRRIHALKGE